MPHITLPEGLPGIIGPMFNRYVDGLATWAPRDTGTYGKIGEMLVKNGYKNSIRNSVK